MKLSTMITKNSVTVNFDGQTHTILSTSPTFEKMKAAIKEGREKDIVELCSPAKRIETASRGAFSVDRGVLMVDDRPVHGALGRQIIEFMEEGLPFQPLIEFCRKLRQNPSFRAVDQLFSFLEKNRHPITASGNFIAYKKVANANSEGKLLDLYTHKIDNSPGVTVEMPRNQVNEDPTVTCSHGLHVANWDYAANHYGSHSDTMLEVEVSPADVVAIPIDYNEAKMRVCRYTVRSVVVNPNDNKHLVREDEVESNVEHDVGEEPETCGSPGCVRCDDPDEDDDLLDEEDDYDDEDPCDEDDGDGGDEEDDDESTPPLTYHSEESIRKMSSERLTKYEERLLNTTPASWNKALHDRTLAMATKVLDDRGVE